MLVAVQADLIQIQPRIFKQKVVKVVVVTALLMVLVLVTMERQIEVVVQVAQSMIQDLHKSQVVLALHL